MYVNNNKLYVGNLPYSLTNDKIAEIFSQFGQVTSGTVITDKFSGRSKGFGFVEFASEADAQKAIDAMNGKELEGRTLVVNVARPMVKRDDRRDDRRSH